MAEAHAALGFEVIQTNAHQLRVDTAVHEVQAAITVRRG